MSSQRTTVAAPRHVAPRHAARSLGATRLALLAAVAGLALTGCSVSPGAAAVVGDRTISQSYLERTMTDLAPVITSADPASLLSVLVVAPVFIDAAAERGVGVSEQEARDLIQSSAEGAGITDLPEMGEGAVQVAQFTLAAENLRGLEDGDALLAELTAEAAALDVVVNPRYGEIDGEAGTITPRVLPWIHVPEASADAAP